MGLFDTIAGAIQGQAGAASGAQGDLLGSAMGMLNDPKVGGLSGLVEKFTQGGLGEQVASWVSTGENLPVSAEQIQSALSSSGLQDIAAKFGFNTNEIAGQLSNLLPQVVDKLTPMVKYQKAMSIYPNWHRQHCQACSATKQHKFFAES